MNVWWRRILAFLLMSLSPASAAAARFPDAVMHRFVLSGTGATELASLLGLSNASPGPKVFSLHPNIVHAVSISRDPALPKTASQLLVTFSKGSLIFEGPCLDTATGSADRSSPFLVMSPTFEAGKWPQDAWGELLNSPDIAKSVQDKGKTGDALVYDKKIPASAAPAIRIRVYRVQVFGKERETWGYQVELGMGA